MDLEGRLSLDSHLSTPHGPISVRRLISYMLSHSNNNYFNLLYHHLTPEGLHRELKEMGIEQTVVLTSMAPAEEVLYLEGNPFMVVMLMTADGPLDLDGAEEAERSLVRSVFDLHQRRAEGVDAYLESETNMIELQTALHEHYQDKIALREQLTSIASEQERLKGWVQRDFVIVLLAVLALMALMALMSLSPGKSWTAAGGRT